MEANEVLKQISDTYKALHPHMIYYALRELRFPRITDRTVDLIRWCIAIQRVGFRISTPLLEAVCGDNSARTLPKLHNLGDKEVLVLIRPKVQQKRFHWMVSDVFMRKVFN